MNTGIDLLKPEIDTAVFSGHHWYVAGYSRFWFTSKEDAEAAIGLARAAAKDERIAVAEKIRNAIDDVT